MQCHFAQQMYRIKDHNDVESRQENNKSRSLQVVHHAHRHNSSHVTLAQMHAPWDDCARKTTIASKGSPKVASILH